MGLNTPSDFGTGGSTEEERAGFVGVIAGAGDTAGASDTAGAGDTAGVEVTVEVVVEGTGEEEAGKATGGEREAWGLREASGEPGGVKRGCEIRTGKIPWD